MLYLPSTHKNVISTGAARFIARRTTHVIST
jgi:hypothetical protein